MMIKIRTGITYLTNTKNGTNQTNLKRPSEVNSDQSCLVVILQPTNRAAPRPVRGKMIFAVKKSKKSKIFIPKILMRPKGPIDNAAKQPVMKQLIEIIRAALCLEKFAFSAKKAVDTSCRKIQEVIAAVNRIT